MAENMKWNMRPLNHRDGDIEIWFSELELFMELCKKRSEKEKFQVVKDILGTHYLTNIKDLLNWASGLNVKNPYTAFKVRMIKLLNLDKRELICYALSLESFCELKMKPSGWLRKLERYFENICLDDLVKEVFIRHTPYKQMILLDNPCWNLEKLINHADELFNEQGLPFVI